MEIKVMKNIMHENTSIANQNREFFNKNNIIAINVMASPGAGKTSTILQVIDALRKNNEVFVIEGDIASSIDADKMEKLLIPVVQINTGGGCHLDANMVREAIKDFSPKDKSFLFVENVGNLVCPSTFDLGEDIKMVIASVPEGHDKPFKYTSMFENANIVVLNKIDLAPYIDFKMDEFYKGIRALNEDVPVFEISCKTGEGIDKLIDFLNSYKKK